VREISWISAHVVFAHITSSSVAGSCEMGTRGSKHRKSAPPPEEERGSEVRETSPSEDAGGVQIDGKAEEDSSPPPVDPNAAAAPAVGEAPEEGQPAPEPVVEENLAEKLIERLTSAPSAVSHPRRSLASIRSF
jgi:hypothetical protein